jgi:hypothetical protein
VTASRLHLGGIVLWTRDARTVLVVMPSCSARRIRLDPGRGGERRCSPPHIATHAMGGDPARRDHTVPAAVWGTSATSVSAPRCSLIGGWAW